MALRFRSAYCCGTTSASRSRLRINFRKRGEFRRGTQYISAVPAEDIEFMERMFELAKKDLKAALSADALDSEEGGDNRGYEESNFHGDEMLPSASA